MDSRGQLFRRTSKMIKYLEGKLVGTALCLLSIPEFIARVQRFWTLWFWQKDNLHLKQAWLTPLSSFKVHLNKKEFLCSKFHGISFAPSEFFLAPLLTCIYSCSSHSYTWNGDVGSGEHEASVWFFTCDLDVGGIWSEMLAVPLPSNTAYLKM